MKAVIFDLFETLVTEWVSNKYTKRMIAGDLGTDCEKFSCTMESLHEEMNVGSCTFEKAIKLSSKSGGVIPTDEQLSVIVKKLTDTKTECFAYKHPEITTMLESLKKSGYRLGLISNCAADEVTAFGNSEIYGYFDTVILSYEAGLCKPDVKIYKLCAEKLGVKPEECLFVGDGGSRELWGARDTGMTPLRAMWFVNKYEKNIKEMPFDKADNPDDIVEYIRKVSGRQVSPCGAVCSECEKFLVQCQGCAVISGKVWWMEYCGGGVCPYYECCVNGKKLPHCGKCSDFPCELFRRGDPAKSKEENAAILEKQLKNLKSSE